MVDNRKRTAWTKIRKSGAGCIFQINSGLWEGIFFPRVPDGSQKKFKVYAKTREEYEKELAKMIEEKKKEIADLKKKSENGITHRGLTEEKLSAIIA